MPQGDQLCQRETRSGTRFADKARSSAARLSLHPLVQVMLQCGLQSHPPRGASPVKRVAKLFIRAGDQYVFSYKRAPGKSKDNRLELLGGHVEQGEEPFEALLREAEEEEITGRLYREVYEQRPVYEEVILRHEGSAEMQCIFRIEIGTDTVAKLVVDPEESYGLELIPVARFDSDTNLAAMRDEFTPKSLAIFRGLGRKV